MVHECGLRSLGVKVSYGLPSFGANTARKEPAVWLGSSESRNTPPYEYSKFIVKDLGKRVYGLGFRL